MISLCMRCNFALQSFCFLIGNGGLHYAGTFLCDFAHAPRETASAVIHMGHGFLTSIESIVRNRQSFDSAPFGYDFTSLDILIID